jgi:hypothetical protein
MREEEAAGGELSLPVRQRIRHRVEIILRLWDLPWTLSRWHGSMQSLVFLSVNWKQSRLVGWLVGVWLGDHKERQRQRAGEKLIVF